MFATLSARSATSPSTPALTTRHPLASLLLTARRVASALLGAALLLVSRLSPAQPERALSAAFLDDSVTDGAVDALPWRPPSPVLPQGSIVIAHHAPSFSGPRVVEWDLARNTPLAAASLATSAQRSGPWSVSLTQRGTHLVALSTAPDRRALLSFVSPSLGVVRTRLLEVFDAAVIAADERSLFVAAYVHERRQYEVIAFDARTGIERARRPLPILPPKDAPQGRLGELVLADGSLWLSIAHLEGKLFKLSRDLQLLTTIPMHDAHVSVSRDETSALVILNHHRRVRALRLKADLSLLSDTPLGLTETLLAPQAAPHPTLGLALDDGRTFLPTGPRQLLTPTVEPLRVLWAHERLIQLARTPDAPGLLLRTTLARPAQAP